MRPVLLITSNHTLQPLWSNLAEHYDLCILGPQAGLAQDMGLAGAFQLMQYANPDRNETAINTAYQMAARLMAGEASASLVSRVAGVVGDEPPEQFKAEAVSKWWPAMTGERVKQLAMLVELLKAVFAERQVVGCVVHEDVTPDMRALVQFCKARGVPTIHVPHANCFYTGAEWDVHTESISSHLAASGAYAKEFYEKWGYEGTVRVTGAPQMDKFYAPGPTREEARRVLGIEAEDFVIVFATSWWQLTSARSKFDVEYQESLNGILSAAKEMRATLVVKMHPGEAQGKEQFYLDALKANGVRGCVLRAYNEYVLRAGDVLVSHGPSNLCVEAATVGLPCAYFPTEAFGFDGGPIAVDGDMGAVRAIEFARSVDGVAGGYWHDFVQRMNDVHGRLDEGTACERIADFVREVCVDQNQN